ncbi:YgfZ/GcvT domain-containing protein [Phenylobacterium immobile]|uniref:CAF17-like 4Fe-4S cluster assembly/insertion protein YgfZ n=1 Tax=Phenylobacterium immobile TaxID=21 RepID=UPI000B1DEBD7|nr:folate-binding protein YgfZ [Phenylobacterium immobile]
MTASFAFASLESRALIAVSGPDWRSFLQGLLTQDVETLGPGEARFAALLTPQGRLLYDMFVVAWPDGMGVWLDVAAEHRAAIAFKLTLYRLRAKVEIAEAGELVAAAPAPGADGLWVADPRLPSLGFRGYGASVPAETQGEDAYEAHRMALGVPGPADWGSDKAYPIEADFDLLNGIDFKKGCFVGQETTSRMKRRGTLKNRMAPLEFDGPAPRPGAMLMAGELRAGEVLSGREGRAMALVRLDRLDGDLSVEGRPVRVIFPEWLEDAAKLVEKPQG